MIITSGLTIGVTEAVFCKDQLELLIVSAPYILPASVKFLVQRVQVSSNSGLGEASRHKTTRVSRAAIIWFCAHFSFGISKYMPSAEHLI